MPITLFDPQFFANLSDKALSSPRKRSHHNLHPDYRDPVQRLFITMTSDSYIRPHRHTQDNKFECFIALQGTLAFFLFDDEGLCTARYELNTEQGTKGIEIPPHTWHCAVCLSTQATFFEVKPGPYEVVEDKDFAPWAPLENDTQATPFLAALNALQVGQAVSL
ncbi:MAG: WbuC family cupin fold metalloprotein [Aestuariibacter sp.]